MLEYELRGKKKCEEESQEDCSEVTAWEVGWRSDGQGAFLTLQKRLENPPGAKGCGKRQVVNNAALWHVD